MSVTGRLAFLPWVTIPAEVSIGGFRFVPVETKNPSSVLGNEIGDTARQVLARYVDMHGKPIASCTGVLRKRHPVAWNIPEDKWDALNFAASTVALAAMAEQEFFNQLAPYTNATIFRPVFQGVTAGSDRIALFIPRRGGGAIRRRVALLRLAFSNANGSLRYEMPSALHALRSRAQQIAHTQVTHLGEP